MATKRLERVAGAPYSRTTLIKHDIRGEGPTVVLLHSGGMSGRQWKRLAERLAPTHRVVSPDFLGSGDNPRWPDDKLFEFGSDVAAVREILSTMPGPFHLVGHSYGGLIALTLAREEADRVRSIALYDPVAFGTLFTAEDEEGLADLARAGNDPVFLDDARGGNEEWFQAFVDYWNGPGAWLGLPPPARAGFLEVGRKVYGEVRSLMQDRTPGSAYAPLDVPALLMTGEHSPTAARRVIVQLSMSLPKAKIEVIDGAGHMGPITHGAKVNESIARHIETAS